MSEIRALLLTDVVDSTQLSERLGDSAMAEVWAAHDRVARDLLPRWRGREIDKTDGMLLLFDAADDALNYALAYHRALAAMAVPLRARAGLHLGPVILRENLAEDVARGAKPLEVDGLAKPTAARVMSLARGGQTLMTPEARAALGPSETLTLQSHGHWVMKGVSAPLELFEAGNEDTVFEAPPDGEKVYRVVRSGERWLPARAIPNNLPQQGNAFIGRGREIDELKALLGNARLITLLGMGGLGKTRLSLQAAAEIMAEYPDGAWFLDLSSIRDAALLVGEAAQVLGVREEPGRPLIQTLCAHLAAQRCLLVMDNCEHLVKTAAEFAHAVLRAAPGVRIMASSREVLRVPGEQIMPILPLPVPEPGDSLAVLKASTAVRLFVARAQAHKPNFVLDEREAPAVAELVARLEGIPLALELAAARVRVLSVIDINKRLDDRYRLLTGGSRVLQERQQTLRALVDWSYDLLSAPEQTLLQRLGVFAGGFDLPAAEQVCGSDPLDALDVMDLLASLVEKSLVMADERGEGTRYRMLETLRVYAREKLEASGGLADTAALHGQYYFALAKEAGRGLLGPEQLVWVNRLEADHGNLRAAMALALVGGLNAIIAVKFTYALLHFWLLRGYATEGRKLVQSVLALPGAQASDQAHAFALYVGACLADRQSDHSQSRAMLETCLALRRGLGHPGEIAATLSTLALAQLSAGDVQAAIAGETEALQIFEGIGDTLGVAVGHAHLGQFALRQGDDGAAARHLELGLALAREHGLLEVQAECQLCLGWIACKPYDLPAWRKAADWFNESLRLCKGSGDRQGEANAQRWLGKVDLQAGNLQTGAQRLAAALQAFHKFDMREPLLGCLEDFVDLALGLGSDTVAAALAAMVQASRDRLGLRRSARDEARWQACMQTLAARLDATGLQAASLQGGAWSTDEALHAALRLVEAKSPEV